MARSSTCATCCLAYAKCVIVGLSIIIIVCIIGAIKGPSAVNKMVADKIKTVVDEMMVLSPSTQLFQNWVDPKVPVYQKFYFFDIQNADDVLNSGAKPRYVEKGPYSYRLHVSRYDVEFGDNDTLSYRQLNWLEFAPEVSAGLENDSITTINVPFVGLASGAKHQDWFSRLTVSALAKIHEHEMFTSLTIGEILWGYEDPLLKQLQLMVGEEKVPTYTIGLLLRTNGSRFSTVVNTGASNSTMLNQIVTFNDKTAFKLWATKEANMINGSDGSIFHPGVTADESFYEFNPMRCRSVPYTYKESQLHYDIPMMKFHIPWYTYANASSYPPNAGFCLQDSCPDGILNVTACTKGPIGMSLPHFLYASPDIIDSFDGIEPNETKHQSYLTVEPITGVSYIQRRRLQMNVYMETVDSIMQTEGVRSMYYPYCWIEMSADVPESIATYFRSNMSIVDGLDVITRYVFIGLAGLCLLIIILMLLCVVTKCCKRKKKGEKKAVKSDSNGGAYVTIPKESNVPSKTYTNGIPKNIYVQIPNDDTNGNNDVIDDRNTNHQRRNSNTESAVLSDDTENEHRTDDETDGGDRDEDRVWKLHKENVLNRCDSGIETEV